MHSALSTQSFSVATYGNIPVLRGRESSPAEDMPPPYVLCEVMHELICASLSSAEFARLCDGSSR